MKVDIDHILFWMDAIRNSDDRYRTLESFWKGQIKSKLWLIDSISAHVSTNNNNIVIHGGWNGVLASLLFQSSIKIDKIVSIDIDPLCKEISNTMNKIEETAGRFRSVVCSMEKYQYEFFPDIVINTSCEHVTQEVYNQWLKNIPYNSLIVLQSNDYFKLTEHIRCVKNIEDFENQSNIKVFSKLILPLSNYNRFMLIGFKK